MVQDIPRAFFYFAQVSNIASSLVINPLMHNVSKQSDGQTHFKNLEANAARFLKCV